MKVTFKQTGGFAGLSFGADLDTDTLPHAEGRRLVQLIESSGIRTLAARGAGGARDLAAYELVVEGDGGTVRTTFDDMSVPPELEPLLDFLRQRARRRPLKA